MEGTFVYVRSFYTFFLLTAPSCSCIYGEFSAGHNLFFFNRQGRDGLIKVWDFKSSSSSSGGGGGGITLNAQSQPVQIFPIGSVNFCQATFADNESGGGDGHCVLATADKTDSQVLYLFCC